MTFVIQSSIKWGMKGFLLLLAATLCSGKNGLNLNPPKIEFYSSLSRDVQIVKNSQTHYYDSEGKSFSLTLKCSAFYPIFWNTAIPTLKKLNITSWTNKRESVQWRINPSQKFNYSTILTVIVNPKSIKLLEKLRYDCYNLKNHSLRNTVFLRHGDDQDIFLVKTEEDFVIPQFENHNSPIDVEADFTNGLKRYSILSFKKDQIDRQNLTCNDVLKMEEIESNSADTENKSMIAIRCRSHKDYLAQGMRLDYLVNGKYRKESNITEITSGEYNEIEINLRNDSSHTIQKVICLAPYWNNGDLCKTTLIPKGKIETDETAIEVGSAKPSTSTTSVLELLNSTDQVIMSTTLNIVTNNSTSDYNNNLATETTVLPALGRKTLSKPMIITVAIVTTSLSMVCIIVMIFSVAVIKRLRESKKNKPILPELNLLMKPENVQNDSIPQKCCDLIKISKENLVIDENSVLRYGKFGIVLKASYIVGCSSIDVAVKTTKNNSEFELISLKKELKVTSQMKKHDNVVQLMGFTTLDNEKLGVVLEFCPNGNLRDYIRKHQFAFRNIKSEEMATDDGSQHDSVITSVDLIKWSIDIARGLEFIGSHDIVHGDLACRKILLSANLTAKLSDFGLAKQLEEYYYVNREEVPMPWKWMAIETLQHQKFSRRSDIWSFGITMWEIFSLGEIPWSGYHWGEEFLSTLASGERPRKPAYASDEIYHVMRQCWRNERSFRPNFGASASALENILAKELQTEDSAQRCDSFIEILNEVDNYLMPKKPALNGKQSSLL